MSCCIHPSIMSVVIGDIQGFAVPSKGNSLQKVLDMATDASVSVDSRKRAYKRKKSTVRRWIKSARCYSQWRLNWCISYEDSFKTINARYFFDIQNGSKRFVRSLKNFQRAIKGRLSNAITSWQMLEYWIDVRSKCLKTSRSSMKSTHPLS